MPHSREYKLEACVVSLDQAHAAEARGADRVEICDRLETEGMTPDAGLVRTLCQILHIPIRVMIRETEVGYEADTFILGKMKASIDELKSLPIEGFVIGLLKDNRLDREALGELISVCDPFPVTIHKAIDLSASMLDDLDWLNAFQNVDTVLSSGGAIKAMDGVDQLLKMKSVFKGNVMAAGKIVPEQLVELHDTLRLNWYHGRAIV